MRGGIVVNRRRGLAPGELTRKYLRTRDAAPGRDEDDYDDLDDYDDYWDAESGRTADDYLVLRALEESIGFLCRKPKLGELLPFSTARPAPAATGVAPAAPGKTQARPTHAPADLTDALAAHIDRLVARAGAHRLAYDGEILVALDRVNSGLHGVEEVLRRFEDRPGPIVMALLFSPFWVRPLASWVPPEGDDGAVLRSLIAHLFLIYPVPRALLQPWLGAGLPGLKWTLWLVLLGQGGTLHRAARRFGWNIGKRFTHHLAAAPDDLTAAEASMWAEVARLGGEPIDFHRLRRSPAFVLDPTDGPPEDPEDADSSPVTRMQADGHRRVAEAAHTFWRETVLWLIRFRDQLNDEACEPILEWAMHLHTEENRWWAPRRPLFSWRGREPAPTLAAALEYRRQRDTPYADLAWKARDLEWEMADGDVLWTVRELLSTKSLLEEGRAMRHCVASYAHRCAQGLTAIFSLRSGDTRRITIELDPFTHRVVQARGVCNRAATHEEQTMLSRWLTATKPKDASATPAR